MAFRKNKIAPIIFRLIEKTATQNAHPRDTEVVHRNSFAQAIDSELSLGASASRCVRLRPAVGIARNAPERTHAVIVLGYRV